MLCLTNIGFLQCFSFGSRKVRYLLLLHLSQNFVLLFLPHKHRVCAVLLPRLPSSLLHRLVFILLYSVIFCFARFASTISGLAVLFPSAPLKFTAFWFSLFYSVCFFYACFAQQAPVCAVIFPRLPSNLRALFFALSVYSFKFVFCVLSLTNLIFLSSFGGNVVRVPVHFFSLPLIFIFFFGG